MTDMKVLTCENIRRVEENAASMGESYLEMMENAGLSVVEEICKRVSVQGKNIIVVCGGGNNGGDGYAVARLLENEGGCVKVIALSEPKTETSVAMKNRYNGEILSFDASYFYEADIIVDAVFGIGFKGEPEGVYKEVLRAVNSSGAYKVSVDIPSGLIANSGEERLCIKADLTVTFIALKSCHLLFPARQYCGETVLRSIGISADAFKNTETVGEIIPPSVFEKRKNNTHKGSYGTAALIVGSYGMAGAAILSTKGCLKSGIGIAKAVLPESIYGIVTSAVPEAVCHIYKPEDKSDTVIENIMSCDAVLIGCGLSKGDFQRKLLMEIIKRYDKKLIIDADGLNLLSGSIDCIKDSKADIILTPHPKEMARLCNVSAAEIEADRPEFAKNLAALLGCTVVLKGSVTLVADKNGKLYFNLTGNPGMATGGSGDVLAGIITAFAAQGMSCTEAAINGVYVHGKAGDKASEKTGEISLLPSDLIECLPEVYKELMR